MNTLYKTYQNPSPKMPAAKSDSKAKELTKKVNNCSFVFGTNFGELKGKRCVVGIDEAGRGPVLGPMVYGIGVALEGSDDQLKALGVNDSKALTEGKRGNIFAQINDPNSPTQAFYSYGLRILTPYYISHCMLQRTKHSLNEISHDAAIDLIRKCLDAGIIVTSIFVDTVGTPETYQKKLEGIFPGIDITVAKKADSLFPVVSAASICAKVTRDKLVQEWEFPEPGIVRPEAGFGSGYPADPGTKEFIQANSDEVFGFPSMIRFGWSTAQNIMDEKCVPVQWEDDGKESGEGKGSKSLLTFYAPSAGHPSIQRHVYFQDAEISSITQF